MNTNNKQVEAELGAALDGDGDHVEAEDRECCGAKEWKGLVQLDEEFVEKGAFRGVQENIEDDVDNQKQGSEGGEEPNGKLKLVSEDRHDPNGLGVLSLRIDLVQLLVGFFQEHQGLIHFLQFLPPLS